MVFGVLGCLLFVRCWFWLWQWWCCGWFGLRLCCVVFDCGVFLTLVVLIGACFAVAGGCVTC